MQPTTTTATTAQPPRPLTPPTASLLNCTPAVDVDPVVAPVAAAVIFAPAPGPPRADIIIGPSAIVLDPTTTSVALVARLITSPEIVRAGPPGRSVCVPMTKAEAEFSVIVGPLLGRVRTAAGGGFVGWGKVGRRFVLEPMTMAVAEGAREMGVPEIVIAGPPGMIVWLFMTNAVEVEDGMGERMRLGVIVMGAAFGVRVCCCGEAGNVVGNGLVLEPIMIAVADGARDIGVPEMVIAGPPGTIVWLFMMKAEGEDAIGERMTLEAIVTGTGARGVGGGDDEGGSRRCQGNCLARYGDRRSTRRECGTWADDDGGGRVWRVDLCADC